MRVLVLAPALYDTSPGQRFRIEQWARYLERDGVRFTFVPFEDEALHRVIYRRGQYVRKAALMLRALARRLRVLAMAPDYDVLVLYREAALVGPAFLERLLARKRLPIVYDFDDPIWLPYRSPTNGAFSCLKWHSKTATICRIASDVIVGNRLLATYARQHARHVHVIPSTIDLERYPPKTTHSTARPVTLGWTGSHSTLPFLELLKDALRRLASQHRFRLLVVSHTDTYRLETVPVEVIARRWNAAAEAVDLGDMDIGLAPFPNTGWTPWRCHGKVLQYMAAGIPVIASPIGILPDVIRDGVNGFLAATDEEWIDRLSRLIEDPGLRRAIGLAGRKTIEECYSADVWVPRVREILQQAVALHRSA